MNEVAKIITISIFLTGVTHLALLIITNKIRIKRLVTYVENFRSANVLTKSDYEYLRDRYTSFMGYMESFPDKTYYKVMYDNPEFDQFVHKMRRRLRYYAIVAAVTLIVLIFILPTST
ncbi:hypothetical protein [Chryseolinea sp. H1M3-3]|uniref:hypothetical protein n=1 Tax=Chryseolinea sp. H1M3-3 TaxID=3034144 RepID=UPI0023EC9760|nr:hypothetical protein [Chryseolinea sp. H1M3-3]